MGDVRYLERDEHVLRLAIEEVLDAPARPEAEDALGSGVVTVLFLASRAHGRPQAHTAHVVAP